jgi:hypothetical protein
MRPGFSDSAGLCEGDHVSGGFFDYSEALEFELSQDGSFSCAGCASKHEALHEITITPGFMGWISDSSIGEGGGCVVFARRIETSMLRSSSLYSMRNVRSAGDILGDRRWMPSPIPKSSRT